MESRQWDQTIGAKEDVSILAIFSEGVNQAACTSLDSHLKALQEAWGLSGLEEVSEIVAGDFTALVRIDCVVKSFQKVFLGLLSPQNRLLRVMNMDFVHFLHLWESEEAGELFTVAINVRAIIRLGFMRCHMQIVKKSTDKLHQNFVYSLVEHFGFSWVNPVLTRLASYFGLPIEVSIAKSRNLRHCLLYSLLSGLSALLRRGCLRGRYLSLDLAWVTGFDSDD